MEEYKDITTGEDLGGLKGINRVKPTPNLTFKSAKTVSEEEREAIRNNTKNLLEFSKSTRNVDSNTQSIRPSSDISELAREVGYGESQYDVNVDKVEDLYNLGDIRAESQSFGAKIGSGIVKGAALAATTFVDNTLGTIASIGTTSASLAKGEDIETAISNGLNNPISTFLYEINDSMESVLPNYYSQEELEQPWYKNIASGNFIGDKLLKNLGFTIGAYYSGKVITGAISKLGAFNNVRKAYSGTVALDKASLETIQSQVSGNVALDGQNIAKILANKAKDLRKADMTLRITGGLASAAGESRMEAVTNTEEWAKGTIANIDKIKEQAINEELYNLNSKHPELFELKYTPGSESSPERWDNIPTNEALELANSLANSKYNFDAQYENIENQKVKSANSIFTANMALVGFGNYVMFGKYLSGGFKTAKKVGNVFNPIITEGKITGFEASKKGVLSKVGKAIERAGSEGIVEEMGQSTAAKATAYKSSSEIESFFKSKGDVDSNKESLGWLEATSKAMLDTYGTVEGWEEGFIGGLTGLLGVPGIRNIKSKSGSLQSPIHLQGNIAEEFRDIDEQNNVNQQAVDKFNTWLSDPKTRAYYQGLFRHNYLDKVLNQALSDDNQLSYKDAEFTQLLSDIDMFNKVGRMDEYLELIEDMATDDNINPEEIRQLGFKPSEDTDIYKDKTDSEIVEFVKKQSADIKKTTENYRKVQDDLRTLLGDKVDEDGIDELTWQVATIQNKEDRFNSLITDLKSTIEPILQVSSLDTYTVEEDGISVENKVSDILSKSPVQLLQDISNNKELQDIVLNTPNNILNEILSLEKSKEGLGRGKKGHITRQINHLVSNIKSLSKNGQMINSKETLNKLEDAIKLAIYRRDFITKYNNFISNPESLSEYINKQSEEVQSSVDADNIVSLEINIEKANTLREVNNILDKASLDNPNLEKELLDKSTNPKVIDLILARKNLNTLNTLITNVNNSDISQEVRDAAIMRLSNMMDNINNSSQVFSTQLIEEGDTDLDIQAKELINSSISKINNTISKDNSINSIMSEADFNETTLTDPSKLISKKAKEDVLVEEANTLLPDETIITNNNNIPIINEAPGKSYQPGVLNYDKSALENKELVSLGNVPSWNKIWSKLTDLGAFEYVDSGKLKLNDKVYFLVDPNFKLEGYDTVIFMAVKKGNGYQVIGSLREDFNTDTFKGLSDLRDKVKEEVKTSDITTNNGMKVAFITSKVDKLMGGAIPLSNTINTLSSIIKDSRLGNDFIIGIKGDNGILGIDKRLSFKSTENLVSGRTYIFLRDTDGRYLPVFINIKRFNSKEFNSEKDRSTDLFKSIEYSIRNIILNKDSDKVDSLVGELSKYLLLDQTHININTNNSTGEQFISIKKDKIKDGYVVKKEVVIDGIPSLVSDTINKTINLTYLNDRAELVSSNIDTVINNVITTLQDLNTPFQVSKSGLLNSNSYTDMIIDSDIISTNLHTTKMVNGWFTISPIVNSTDSISTKPSTVTQLIGDTLPLAYSLGTNTYFIDNSGRVTNELGATVTDSSIIEKVIAGKYSIDNPSNISNNLIRVPTLNNRLFNTVTREWVTEIEKSSNEDILSKLEEDNSKVVIDSIDAPNSNTYYKVREGNLLVPYRRVESLIGNNFKPKDGIIDNINKTVNKLSSINNSTKENILKYLSNLQLRSGVDLSKFVGIVNTTGILTPKSINSIKQLLLDKSTIYVNDNQSLFKSIIGEYLINDSIPTLSKSLSEKPLEQIKDILINFKKILTDNNYTIIGTNLHAFDSSKKIVTTIDILIKSPNNSYSIYKIKMFNYSIEPFTNKEGKVINYFTEKSDYKYISDEQQLIKELSYSKHIIENKYGIKVNKVNVLPIITKIEENNITNVSSPGIISLDLTNKSSKIVPIGDNSKMSIIENKTPKKPLSTTRKPIGRTIQAPNITSEINNSNNLVTTEISSKFELSEENRSKLKSIGLTNNEITSLSKVEIEKLLKCN